MTIELYPGCPELDNARDGLLERPVPLSWQKVRDNVSVEEVQQMVRIARMGWQIVFDRRGVGRPVAFMEEKEI